MEFFEFDTEFVAGNDKLYSGICGLTKWFCSAARQKSLQLETKVAAPAKIEVKQSIKR